MEQALLVKYNEANMIRSAAQGDCDAFNMLVSLYRDQVFRLGLRMLGNREDAEDIQQETFVQAYRGLKRFRGDSTFGTWLYGIASRLCISRLRRGKNRFETIDIEKHSGELIEDGPEDCLLARESAERIQSVLGRLSPKDRLLIVLKFVEGLNHEEIAVVLGCSAQSSRSRLLRAKKLFRLHYERME